MRLLQTGGFARFAFLDEGADQDIEHRRQQQAKKVTPIIPENTATPMA